jgi:hypothetical protein
LRHRVFFSPQAMNERLAIRFSMHIRNMAHTNGFSLRR